MLTLQLKTTRIILINNLIQQLARQSTPCRAQGISCKCHQVYKSPNLFRGFFHILCDELDKLARQRQAVNSHLQICESCTIDCYTGTNRVLMSDNPESQRALEIFLEWLKKLFHSYYIFNGYYFTYYVILLYLLIQQNVSKRTFSVQKSFYAGTFLSFSIADLQIRLTDWVVIW